MKDKTAIVRALRGILPKDASLDKAKEERGAAILARSADVVRHLI